MNQLAWGSDSSPRSTIPFSNCSLKAQTTNEGKKCSGLSLGITRLQASHWCMGARMSLWKHVCLHILIHQLISKLHWCCVICWISGLRNTDMICLGGSGTEAGLGGVSLQQTTPGILYWDLLCAELQSQTQTACTMLNPADSLVARRINHLGMFMFLDVCTMMQVCLQVDVVELCYNNPAVSPWSKELPFMAIDSQLLAEGHSALDEERRQG